MSRLRATLADDLTIAINPALIMLLVGSLVFFLLELFYQGHYPEKLHFCLAAFVFGAVLIARISMEEGWERAVPFGLALAVVTLMAMGKFVDYRGTAVETFSGMLNIALIGLTWWCAHQLTWDCTLVDDNQDASGEGLLQTVGLDRPETKEGEQPIKNEAECKQPGRKRAARSTGPVAADELPAFETIAPPPRGASLWERFLERRRRPHAPGVWVVYFSLAALPLFGIGQAFIPAAKVESRQYAFLLLCLYVASGLGLLLTTSFLGLRRYLRQRKLEMPLAMVGTWLATGTVLIVALLLVSALIPRPNAEYAISQLPFVSSSDEHEPSKIATGSEGTKNKDGRQDTQASKSPDDKKTEENQSQDSPENQGEKKGRQEKDDDSKGDGKSQGGNSKDGNGSSSKSSEGQQREKQDDSKSQPNKSQQEQQTGQQQQPQPTQQSTPPPQSSPVGKIAGLLFAILKWLFYGVLVCIAAWAAWRYRAELLAWLQGLIDGWRDFWQRLFGRQATEIEAEQSPSRQKAFWEYPDPFAAGTAGRFSTEQLVRYSFEALEAWARDNGCPRGEDQTVHEFARQLGASHEHLTAPVRVLADLYSRVAYAKGSLPASSVEHLRTFWRSLQTEQSTV